MKIYHGVVKDHLKTILKHGINEKSYWGDISEASKYSDVSQAFELDTDSTGYSFLPNETLVEYYEENEPDNSGYLDWLKSKQTWQDSLKCFGSIIIEEKILPDDLEIINI